MNTVAKAFAIVFAACAFVGCHSYAKGPLYETHGIDLDKWSPDSAEELVKRLREVYPEGSDAILVRRELEMSGGDCFVSRYEYRTDGSIVIYGYRHFPEKFELVTREDPRYQWLRGRHYSVDCIYYLRAVRAGVRLAIGFGADNEDRLTDLGVASTRP